MKTSSLTAEIDRLLATLHRLRQSDEAGESYVRVFQELCDLAFPQETSKAVKQEKLRRLQSARNNLKTRESEYLQVKKGRKNPEPKSKGKQGSKRGGPRARAREGERSWSSFVPSFG